MNNLTIARNPHTCAHYTINGLIHFSNPADVMEEFCKQVFCNTTLYNAYDAVPAVFYTFCCGPEVGGHYWSNQKWLKYGTEFAGFIKENRLGELATLGPKINAKHHPDTTAQIWIWHPDAAALKIWYDKVLTNNKKDKKVIENDINDW